MGSEAKFKVGDRVRFVEEYGRASVGTEGVITGFWSNGVQVDVNGEDHSCYSDRIELVKSPVFKVGDRVRLTKDNDGCGDVGDVGVIKDVDSDGFCYVSFETGSQIGESWFVDCFGFEHAPLTIEAGKFYITRDGRRVGPMERGRSQDPQHYWRSPKDAGYLDGYDAAWCKSGSFYKDERPFRFDLISEAPTPTYTANAAAEVDNLADEYGGGKPRFKVGDRVRYVTTCPSYEAHYDDGELVIRSIGGGDFNDDVDLNYPHLYDGYYIQVARLIDIEHVNPPTTSAIVALVENGQPKPSHLPYVHNTRASAETEAKRLAGKHKGKEFGVYELLSTIKEEPVYEHEWQRLAASGLDESAASELSRLSGLPWDVAHKATKQFAREAA